MLAGKVGFFRSTIDPDAAAYLAAVEAADGQALEAAVRTAINDFVVGCKNDGLWSSIKTCGLLMGARTLSGALKPLVGPTPTNFNFVSGDYNRKTGLVGDSSTKRIDTGWNPSGVGQDDVSQAVYCTSFGTAATSPLIDSGRSSVGAFGLFYEQGPVRFRNRNQTIDSFTGTATTGFIGQARQSSTQFVYRVNGTTSTVTRTSQTPYNGNMGLFAFSIAVYSYCNARLSFWHGGQFVNLALLNSRVTTLYNAIGAAIP